MPISRVVRGQGSKISISLIWNFFCRNYVTWVICRYFYFLVWAIFGQVIGSQSWDANKEYTTARGDPETKMLQKNPQATPLPPVLKVFNQSQQHTEHPQKISGLSFTVFRRYSKIKLLFRKKKNRDFRDFHDFRNFWLFSKIFLHEKENDSLRIIS